MKIRPKFADHADEEDAMFDALRISLKDVFCQIAVICKDDFVTYVTSMLSGTFNKLLLAQSTGKSFSERFDDKITKVVLSRQLPRRAGFLNYPDYIPSVLQSFVDSRGLHHQNRAVRNRVNNLFLEFIKEIKLKVAPFADVVLDNIQDLLDVFTPENMDNDVNNAIFNNHCFLFEAVGLLIAFDVNKHMKETAVLIVQTLEVMSDNQIIRYCFVFGASGLFRKSSGNGV
ncbi:hypothetical protein BJ742DRAFT_280898 [Cladochytrium replicatum]|nr:hypothetical protein BJ742DRAFT_280898 [Cladochytrium replicatum]